MKCKYCGKELLDGAKFCVYCGKPIEEEQPVQQVEPTNSQSNEQKITFQQPMPQISVQDNNITERAKEEVKEENTIIENVVPASISNIDSNTQQQMPSFNVNEESMKEIKQEPTIVDIVTPAPVIETINNSDIKNEKQSVEQNVPTPIELPKEEQKNNIQQEVVTKIVKKNNPILIVIIFILLAIIIGGSIFVYTKYIANDTKSSSNKSPQAISETTDQYYDADKAKELIDKYYYSFTAQPDQNLFTADMTEEVKKNIVLNNLKDEFKKIECSQITGFVTDSSGKCVKINDTTIYTEGTIIDYDTFNNKYKYLFGKSNEVSKEVFKDLTYFVSWEYIEDKNVFLQTIGIGGLEITPYYSTYFVKKAETNNDELIIDVAYIYMNRGFDVDSNLKTTIAGEEVTFKESETQKEGFDQEIKDKYLDKLDTYEFTFKYEDDHYVFVDMKKI